MELNPLVGRTVPGIGPGGWGGRVTLTNMQRPLTGLQMIERAYRKLIHQPNNPLVRAAYAALITELWAQFEVLQRTYRFVFTEVDPYVSSSGMFADLEMARTLRVYTGGELPQNHPLATLSPNGESYNSIFRAVHDALAHYPKRYSFSPAGELRAFRAHCEMLSPMAQWAIATETLGQGAYYAVHQRFAPQRADLLPAGMVADAIEGRIHV